MPQPAPEVTGKDPVMTAGPLNALKTKEVKMDRRKLSEKYQLTLPSGAIIRNINGLDKETIQKTGQFPFSILRCSQCGCRHHPAQEDYICIQCGGAIFEVVF